jgi:hypothetical protein
VPKFNRERRIVELLRGGNAVLLIKSWDTPGVLAAGRAFADALEHPASMTWAAHPPEPLDSSAHTRRASSRS